jgi:hypothetical protein
MDWPTAEQLARKPRPCPWCSSAAIVVFMRAQIDPGLGFMREGPEVIRGPHLRWACRVCGLGEVVEILPDPPEGAEDEAA